jgi:hypothetical protein
MEGVFWRRQGRGQFGPRVVRARCRVAVRVASLCLVGFGDPACRGEVGTIAGGRGRSSWCCRRAKRRGWRPERGVAFDSAVANRTHVFCMHYLTCRAATCPQGTIGVAEWASFGRHPNCQLGLNEAMVNSQERDRGRSRHEKSRSREKDRKDKKHDRFVSARTGFPTMCSTHGPVVHICCPRV